MSTAEISGDMQPVHSTYTPIQKKMLEVLKDGLPHKRSELHACLNDDMGALSNIKAHLTFIRKKLRPNGEEIICELHKGYICYRHVKLLS